MRHEGKKQKGKKGKIMEIKNACVEKKRKMKDRDRDGEREMRRDGEVKGRGRKGERIER